MPSLAERLLAHSAIAPSGCRLWQRGRGADGYGLIKVGRKMQRAHRMAYAQFVGPIPDGADVCHKCDTPLCINPEHLFAGAHKENMLDASRKGRLPGNRTIRGVGNMKAKLSESDVIAIRNSDAGPTALGLIYGVSRDTIRRARNGTNWRHLWP